MPLLLILWLMAFAALPTSLAHAQDRRHPWFFTANEIAVSYRYQHNFGKGLHQPLRALPCVYGAKKFEAWYFDGMIEFPCHFIRETLRHLSEILDAGAAKYFFPLDLDHAHLAIPKKSWLEKYQKLPSGKVLPAMMQDRQMIALYHSAEHLAIKDPKTGKINQAAKLWRDKRNILGFYDGRPIEILPPHPRGDGLSVPDDYWSYGGFNFLSSPHGRLAVLSDTKSVLVDIKFQLGGERPRQLPAKIIPKQTGE